MNTLLLIGRGTPPLWEAPITYLILAITIYTSYQAFEDYSLKDKMIFRPASMARTGEWYRFLSHGLIHSDGRHLLFNSLALFFFGTSLEPELRLIFGQAIGPLVYLVLYVSGLIMASLYSYYKHQDDSWYTALGASGAVCSVVFACILVYPMNGIGLLFISDITGMYIPGIIFGPLYLWYCVYKSKLNNDNIGHDAHYWGSVWGFVFLASLKPSLVLSFLEQIKYGVMNMF